MRYLFCLIGWLLCHGSVSGQEISLSRKNRELSEKAARAWDARDLDKSFTLYEQLLKAEPRLAVAHVRMAQLYEWRKNTELTAWHYRQAVVMQPDSPDILPALQWLGRYTFSREQYDSSITYLEQVLRLSEGKKGNNLLHLTERMLASARFAREAVKHPVPIERRSLSDTVNFLAMQFFPVLTADKETLIFTGLTAQRDENIYISSWKSGSWSAPQPLSPVINTASNEGTCTISADGRTLVFTGCSRPDGYGSCDLYITYQTPDGWTPPKNLGEPVNTRHWESQPSLSADGQALYFASDRPGGIGKADLWKSEKNEAGNWSEPVNLGPAVNTPEDENAPFVHANKHTLFYASRGLPGMGGFDIFMTTGADTSWSEPVNLGYPINNGGDQVGLFITSDGQSAYYTEDRTEPGKGRTSRLFSFDIPDTLRRQFVTTCYLKGRILDSETNAPVVAHIRLYNLENHQLVSDFVSQEGTGAYLAVINRGARLALYVESDGYLFKSMAFDVADTTSALKMDILIEKIQKDRIETLNNIYFESGAYTLDEKSKVELDKLVAFLTHNPSLQIEIAGHTDAVGSDSDNLELSEKRAGAVAAYLETHGISKERLQFKGYGEQQPKLPDTSEENRRVNRRIEWRIL